MERHNDQQHVRETELNQHDEDMANAEAGEDQLVQEDQTQVNTEPMHDHKQRYVLAGIGPRFIAYLLDLLLIGAIFFLTVQPVLYLVGAELYTTETFSAYVILSSLIGYLYFVVMTKIWGQTLGKMIFGLRVVRKDGASLDWGTAFFREAVGKFISKLFGIHLGFIWALFYPKRQAWHDLIGDTYVVMEQEVYKRQYVEV
ncbi:RDD family protein [Caldalkalibacillus salinus]|uniref:RDD family protein n=1 Tax=Caldalkalibacillus salinus TaxID=2803787 RepID=UPI001F20590C|nr:RDD family protein [Caldalkalibacillus salinus]